MKMLPRAGGVVDSFWSFGRQSSSESVDLATNPQQVLIAEEDFRRKANPWGGCASPCGEGPFRLKGPTLATARFAVVTEAEDDD